MNESLINQSSKCQCGTTILDQNVKVKYKYSLWGWFLWSQGSTVIPKKMQFICTNCNKLFCELTNKEQIKEYMIINPY